ncbi:hypothetical protein N657DRAFT_640867 [Parathielavia appendiculata]|uniref:S-adenosyl-L-methionine-dependent methyltransferase n=1 Tax=Parathielavia appendiculata TaxID=2587402 RepID=A0AAN6Z7D4_9PEZI|nr:hypothetical protein N657DRAFT_640867 [Parathielavia appendiculata]
MASCHRIPQRMLKKTQLPAPALPSCTCARNSPSSRTFTLSTRLDVRPPPIVKLRAQRTPQTPPLPSSSSSSSSSKAQPLDVLVNQRKWPLFGAGIFALCAGLYLSSVLTSSLKDTSAAPSCTCTSPSPAAQPPPTGLPSTLDLTNPTTAATTAQAFDKSLAVPEWLMGITSLRQSLASRARGHVLEVAVGTGRNLAYYDWSEVVSLSQDEAEARAQRERERVRKLLDQHRLGGPTVREQLDRSGSLEGEVLSFTGVDVSGEMMGVARDRIRETVPGLRRIMRKRRLEPMPRLGVDQVGEGGMPVVEALDGRVRLVIGDAVRGLPPPPPLPAAGSSDPPAKYDTIIQTFGLCSVADPGTLLANMAAKLQPDTGRIILLEHGRGHYSWLNRRLDKSAPKHFQKYGCWWNRDIEQIVHEATEKVPGLEVVEVERPLWFQFGTTLLIELRVKTQQNREQG